MDLFSPGHLASACDECCYPMKTEKSQFSVVIALFHYFHTRDITNTATPWKCKSNSNACVKSYFLKFANCYLGELEKQTVPLPPPPPPQYPKEMILLPEDDADLY